MSYEAVIGLEIHAELLTESKMFCACPVVDVTAAQSNVAVCPICSGMPGTLPVINEQAVTYALRVALALGCEINQTSIFARKNYFYPDLPKGYQISQYEQPLARNGQLSIQTSEGDQLVRIRRVHLEEDTGKSTHLAGEMEKEDEPSDAGYSLIDLNRAGVPLLEIVTEPDMHTPEAVGACARALRQLLQYLDVNTGDMQKGVLRIEPNISIRALGSSALGTRTEIKNLNSFRALERATSFEFIRQREILEKGGEIVQQTIGWDENLQVTVPQRGKEEAHDYRYFPEPDLPPLVVDEAWIAVVRASLPELPAVRAERFQHQYGLSAYDAALLTSTQQTAGYFEKAAAAARKTAPKVISNWITGELFGLLKNDGVRIQDCAVRPGELAELLELLTAGQINNASAKRALAAMFETGGAADKTIAELGLSQVSDEDAIAGWVQAVLTENPGEVKEFAEGKAAIENWLFGQVMQKAGGRANPSVIRAQLEKQLRDIINNQRES